MYQTLINKNDLEMRT